MQTENMDFDSLDQKGKSGKKIFFLFFLLLFLNIIYLDISLFVKNKPGVVEKLIISPPPTSSNIIQSPNQMCPQSCISQIYEATASHKLIVAVTPTPTPTPTLAPTTQQNNFSSSLVKEFYIPFGSGSNASDDWQDLAGIQTYINSSSYSQIKSVTFEVSMRIPTGNQTAYARLFNATDKHPVWFSEVSLDGGTPKLLLSKPITLDTGNILYQVQMKTSLKYQAIIDQAKIHIVTY